MQRAGIDIKMPVRQYSIACAEAGMTIEQQSEFQVVPMDAALGAEVRGLDAASGLTPRILDMVNAPTSAS